MYRTSTTGTWTPVSGVGNDITALQATQDGGLYIGTPSGLYRMDTVAAKAKLEPTPPMTKQSASRTISRSRA